MVFEEPYPRYRRELARDRAYLAIRDAIVDGTLPPGEQIRDQDLCRQLGLSRTPVREALARLEADGLVETAPQSYTRVTWLDRRAARDAFPVVAAMHALAAELAPLSELLVEAMRRENERFAEALRAGDVNEAIAADDAFHNVFVTTSGNAEIPRVLERVMPRVRRLERLRFGSLAGRGSVKEHAAIIDAAAANDVQTTAERVRENWLSLGNLIDRSFE
jgi:DNA-binding GntR family transcriptional regulator